MIFPPPCTFSGSVLLTTGATTGNGLTPGTAWVMDAGDTIQVTPPSGTQFVSTTFQASDPAGSIVYQQTSLNNGTPANPVLFTWVNQSQGTYTAGTGVWDVGALASGATATLQIVVTVNGTSPVVNVATRTSSTPTDPNPANDSRSSTVTGSTIPGLPNNGVAPLAQLWPSLAVFLIIVLALIAGPRVASAARRR